MRVYCRKCGSEMLRGERLCKRCGTQRKAMSFGLKGTYCSQCRVPNLPDAVFCTLCGK